MENEVWKDIVGYEGLYQVSNLGKVKSLKRKVYAGRNRMRWQYERILSNNKTNGNGYIVVSLNKESKSKNKYVHRLVAEAFLENPNNYKYINHKDQNTFNNNVNNLEFCTAQYNSTYRDAHIKRGLKHRNNLVNSKKVYQLDENETLCVKGTKDLGRETMPGVAVNKDLCECVIPSEFNGLKITSIDGYAFSCCLNLSSVSIPDSVTHIDKGIFFMSFKITNIKIPSSVKTIDEEAFVMCPLSNIEIDKQKDSIPGAPWGAKDAVVKWLED